MKGKLKYVEFMRLHKGGEGDTGESWLVLFPIEELLDINEEYLEVIGESIENLPADINNYWEEN